MILFPELRRPGSDRAPALTPMWRETLSRPRAVSLLLLLITAVVTVFSGCTAGSLFSTTVWAAPVLLDDRTVALGTQTGHLVIGDMTTGAELGRCVTQEGRNSVRAIYGTPALSGDRILAGGFGGTLYAERRENLFAESEAECTPFFSADSAIVGGPVVTDNMILVGTESGTLFALDEDSGQPLWTFQADAGIWGPPLVGDGLAYVGTLSGVLHAIRLSRSGGSEVWRHEAGAGIGGMTLDDGVLYAGSFDRKLYALDAVTGRPEWVEPFQARNWFWAAPLVLNGRIFAPSLDHNVYILDAATGRAVADPVVTGGAVRSDPAIVGNRVIVANEESETWWIDPVTGLGMVGGKLPAAMYAPVVPIDDAALFFAQDGIVYRASPQLRQPVRVFPLG